MNFDNIEKPSLKYSLLFAYGKFIHDKLFYKKVIYTGTENIPKDKPVLIAPNHQNALMDALAVIFSANRKVIFLARSDIFQNPFIAKLLIFLGILPVYRIRDGKEKLKLNDIIYDKTIQILEAKHPLSIFPEATHNDKMHLQVFKKGIQRVALMTQDKHNNQIDVQIVPTGIYYSNYFNAGSVLRVNYGKPISASKYYQNFKENEAKAMVALGNEMFDKILEMAVNVEDDKNYDVYKLLLDICDKNVNIKQKFNSDKQTVDKIEKISEQNPEKFNILSEKVRTYSEKLNKFRLKDWVLEKKFGFADIIYKTFFTILGFPLFLFGFLINALPFYAPSLITKKLKDPQFISSIRYGMSVFVFPVYYLLLYILVSAISGFWLYTAIAIIVAPFTGLLAFKYHRFFVKFTAQIRFFTNKNKPEYTEMINLRNDILKIMN